MGGKPSCMQSEEPNVVLKVKAACCNKTIQIHIDDVDRIKALLEYVHKLSDESKHRSTVV